MLSIINISMVRRTGIFVTVVLLAGLSLIWPETATAKQCKPLLLRGKRTLFQRVVTHPGACLRASSGDSAPILQSWIKPFTAFYVYDRVSVAGSLWLEVGRSSNCEIDGWIKGDKVSEWQQSLTLVFTERTGRQPVLFFKDLQSLERVAASPSPGDTALRLASQFVDMQSGRISPIENFPVLAMEPAWKAIPRKRFYLMPIFQAVELFEGVKFLKVASIDPGTGILPRGTPLKTGIVFVLDTTISMGPYIERTRKAVRRIYDAIDAAGLSDKVAFALVAFRSNIDKTPGLGYVSKVISGFRDGTQRTQFERALAAAREASVSSHSFNEDAFAGLKTALEDLNWGPYLSRLIFLITDAGAIGKDDPYSTTHMDEKEIAAMAEAKGVKIFALHLKTPAGKKCHDYDYAEEQYRKLTGHQDPTIGDLYVPIDASQPASGIQGFGRVVEGVADQMVKLVRTVASGQRMQIPGKPSTEGSDVAGVAAYKAAMLGYAMQLEFLGRHDLARAPKVVSGWVSDMDLANPERPSFQVTLMLTKNQLSDLHHRLRIILDQAQRTKRTGARDFFESILSVAAQTSRDPERFRKNPNENLGELGILSEFLEDLPYKSNIMRLTEDDWYRMSVGEQQALVDDLKAKIAVYEQYYDDVANWTSFGSSNPGDWVYRVPLSMMP